ncbi:hypothetical protein K8I31_21355 [bacterium]|nr:hypothetical protein [bacterium]
MSLYFFQRTAAFVLVLSLALLAATAALPILNGAQLTSYVLIAHISLSPIFVFAFLVYMLFSSPKIITQQLSALRIFLSCLYLLSLASAIAAIAIIPLTMLPIFSTDWLEWLLIMHQRCAIIMLCCTLAYMACRVFLRSRLFEE